jgi:hypothetical protein
MSEMSLYEKTMMTIAELDTLNKLAGNEFLSEEAKKAVNDHIIVCVERMKDLNKK